MSSRRLLVLLEHAPEVGPYKTALRGGDWPEWMQMIKEIHKEIALNRASKYVGGPNEYRPNVFLSPTERVEHHDEKAAEDQEFDDLLSELVDD